MGRVQALGGSPAAGHVAGGQRRTQWAAPEGNFSRGLWTRPHDATHCKPLCGRCRRRSSAFVTRRWLKGMGCCAGLHWCFARLPRPRIPQRGWRPAHSGRGGGAAAVAERQRGRSVLGGPPHIPGWKPCDAGPACGTAWAGADQVSAWGTLWRRTQPHSHRLHGGVRPVKQRIAGAVRLELLLRLRALAAPGLKLGPKGVPHAAVPPRVNLCRIRAAQFLSTLG